jgi:putative acyl-CoA dehydrogenase
MECLGGNGYVEELPLARLYREVPVNAIWEGSGNVMGLDVMRVLQRSPETADLVLAALGEMAAGEPQLEVSLYALKEALARPADIEAEMRTVVERLAVLTAGCLLRANAPSAVSDAFIGTRVAGGWRNTYGVGLRGADTGAILERALPAA